MFFSLFSSLFSSFISVAMLGDNKSGGVDEKAEYMNKFVRGRWCFHWSEPISYLYLSWYFYLCSCDWLCLGISFFLCICICICLGTFGFVFVIAFVLVFFSFFRIFICLCISFFVFVIALSLFLSTSQAQIRIYVCPGISVFVLSSCHGVCIFLHWVLKKIMIGHNTLLYLHDFFKILLIWHSKLYNGRRLRSFKTWNIESIVFLQKSQRARILIRNFSTLAIWSCHQLAIRNQDETCQYITIKCSRVGCSQLFHKDWQD